jgi:hypothetical protein
VRKQYRIKELPRYLVLHFCRFTKNNFNLEKNPTIVTFPVRNLEMAPYLFQDEDNSGGSSSSSSSRSSSAAKVAAPTLAEVQGSMSQAELAATVQRLGSPHELEQLQRLLLQAQADTNEAQAEGSSSGSSSGNGSSSGSGSGSADLKCLCVSVVERVQAAHRSTTKYDLVAAVSHESQSGGGRTGSGQGAVTLGDVNGAVDRTKTKAAAHSKAADAAASLRSSTEEGGGGTGAAAAARGNNGVLSQGHYKINVHSKATGQWFEINDLRVRETSPQLIGVSEAYILVYEKKASV